MATKRYYPSPDLDMAVYYLQNNPAARSVDPKRLQHIPVGNGRTIGRNAWARAKQALAQTSETRSQVCFDTKTLLTAYIGSHTRIVTRAKSRESFLKRIEMVQVVGKMKHVYTSPDKRFYIYERPIAEGEAAA
jgi:hypothetical protein